MYSLQRCKFTNVKTYSLQNSVNLSVTPLYFNEYNYFLHIYPQTVLVYYKFGLNLPGLLWKLKRPTTK